MKQTLLRNASLFSRNLLLSPLNFKLNPSPSLVPAVAWSRSQLNFFSSDGSKLTQTQSSSGSEDVDDVSTTELKKLIDKYLLEGDMEAIPSIFEAILKRKLSGKHEESDDELMKEIRKMPIRDDMEDDPEDSDEIDESSDEEDDLKTS